MKTKISIFLLLIFLIASQNLEANKKKDKNKQANDTIKSSVVSGLKFRSIGPALASGRIADFAVNRDNPSEYYVAVASGNVWKTTKK